MARPTRYPSDHGTTGMNHRDGHNLGAPQSSDTVHTVKSVQTSSVEKPRDTLRGTGDKCGGC